ncbi:MAG: CtsR family transcriptional regulator [Christensenella sp.]
MSILSDSIEDFIKELMSEEEGTAELQRNELAQRFNCAPSQINYVLTTRFSPNRGYTTQSRRGGGGYIRVIRLNLDRRDYIAQIIDQSLNESINMRQGAEVIEGLAQTGAIGGGIKKVMLAAISDKALSAVPEYRNELRSSVLKEMLTSILIREDD